MCVWNPEREDLLIRKGRVGIFPSKKCKFKKLTARKLGDLAEATRANLFLRRPEPTRSAAYHVIINTREFIVLRSTSTLEGSICYFD